MGQEEIKIKIENLSFEDAIERLEMIVEMLEGGETPLEEMINLYQEGVLLARHCDKKLSVVEQKIQLLIEEDGKLLITDFEDKEG